MSSCGTVKPAVRESGLLPGDTPNIRSVTSDEKFSRRRAHRTLNPCRLSSEKLSRYLSSISTTGPLPRHFRVYPVQLRTLLTNYDRAAVLPLYQRFEND